MANTPAGSTKAAIAGALIIFGGMIALMAGMLYREKVRQEAGLWPKGHRKDNMESMAAALEAYRADHGAYPPAVPLRHFVVREKLVEATRGLTQMTVSPVLTTPVAYLDELPGDPHAPEWKLPFTYFADDHGWILVSTGRDHDYDLQELGKVFSGADTKPREELLLETYDPTNGKKSSGDIWMTSQGFHEQVFIQAR